MTKKSIYQDSTVICSCGKKYKTRSTQKEIKVEICANCHPFYTGSNTLSSSKGKAQKFIEKHGLNNKKEQT